MAAEIRIGSDSTGLLLKESPSSDTNYDHVLTYSTTTGEVKHRTINKGYELPQTVPSVYSSEYKKVIEVTGTGVASWSAFQLPTDAGTSGSIIQYTSNGVTDWTSYHVPFINADVDDAALLSSINGSSIWSPYSLPTDLPNPYSNTYKRVIEIDKLGNASWSEFQLPPAPDTGTGRVIQQISNGVTVWTPYKLPTVVPAYNRSVPMININGTNAWSPYSLPTTDGTSGQYITTNGSGILSWVTDPLSLWLNTDTSTTPNIKLGYNAGSDLVADTNNTIIGYKSYYKPYLSGVNKNVAIGNYIFSNVVGYDNDSYENVYIGYAAAKDQYALNKRNVSIGSRSMENITGDLVASDNVCIGYGAGNTGIGENNVIIGSRGVTASDTFTGNNCVFIGYEAGADITNLDYKLLIDSRDYTNPLIYGDFSSGYLLVKTKTANSKVFRVNGQAGGTTAWANESDSRLKENITNINHSLDTLTKLRGVNFEWIDKRTKGNDIGFIAQEVQDVLPEAVIDGEILSVNTIPIIALLVESIKELRTRLEILENK